ncbi:MULTISPECIES: YbaB/EbfC family nucleoid-associated protein [unclassified Crossiella]|uniref:YbaB/EbfC family nucleoid-associated protein n=1 Tax=unclassified Crossiella TaxID=2620835 RepID=UPI001FFE2F4C|nr:MULTISPECIES: YbaB/EbfC family DNA-binding protein [unclassified Crossiella]MCK2238310.1 YbaB/EbfC family DNA-binding protein [Crossiella sp. S99.2]MCK2256350.1 YbaB/EbfC family DNA-binding protein [Crossiella sp. S99.1]
MHEDYVEADNARAAAKIAETDQRVSERLARSGPVLGRARSGDGAVRVTVVPGGEIQEVLIDQRALQLGSAQLAAEVLKQAQRATRDAAGRLHRTLHGVLDARASEGLTALGMAPQPVTDDDDEDGGSFLRRAR